MLREETTQTLTVMVTADVFLNPCHSGKLKEVVPKVMAYLGSKLGMTLKDVHGLSPKLASQLSEVLGTSETGSRKSKKTATGDAPADPESKNQEKEKRRRKAAEPKASGRKRKADVTE